MRSFVASVVRSTSTIILPLRKSVAKYMNTEIDRVLVEATMERIESTRPHSEGQQDWRHCDVRGQRRVQHGGMDLGGAPDRCCVSPGTSVIQGVTIGRDCFVAAGAVIHRDLADRSRRAKAE
jgi:UDP-3-O-[3-hydroxymyristoyl] glucosamine N-acyltransferase